MSKLDKYLQLLNSPKANIRYDACEELRLVKESSEQTILALEKALQDKDPDVADAAERALKAEAHQQMLVQLGRATAKTESEIQKEEEAKTFASIVMVTTPSLENHTVQEYLGIISAEVVLGTGFLSEFGAGLADMLGIRSDKFQNKLKEAKGAAMKELWTRAYELRANAILGVDLDYSVLSNNLLMVVANGTAVRVEPSSSNAIAAH
jgi:uncharacterized protein YbjQ (UPF0145 family)